MLRVLAACALAAGAAAAGPEQIHLAVTGVETEMHVGWAVVGGPCEASGQVDFEPADGSGSPSTAKASPYLFSTGMSTPLCLWDATMTGLVPNVQYNYTVSTSSFPPAGPFTFTSLPNNQRPGGKTYAVYADLGLDNDVSLAQIVAEAQAGAFDMVLHSGDFAYDLTTTKGQRGNDYMNALQPVAALVPYMGSVGNHEHALNFSAYKARFYGFKQAQVRSRSPSLLYYSFEDDLVHFTVIDTETYWYCNGTASLCKEQQEAQLAWLEADLASVNRTTTPWLIVLGHKQGFMDSIGSANFTKLEALMQAAGVDLYLLGHQHNYNRLLPQVHNVVEDGCVNADYSLYLNCRNMTSIVVGSPGCREKISKGSAPDGVAKLILAYGFAHMQVVNATALHWTWEELGQRDPRTGAFVPREGAATDEMWMVKDWHVTGRR